MSPPPHLQKRNGRIDAASVIHAQVDGGVQVLGIPKDP